MPLRGECHISVFLELQDPHTLQEDLLRSPRFLAGNLGNQAEGKGILFWYPLEAEGGIEEVVTLGSLGYRLVLHFGVSAAVLPPPPHSCMAPRGDFSLW